LKAQCIFWSFIVVGLAADLCSKKMIFDWLGHRPSREVSIIDGFLRFVMALNDGAAFGMFAGRPYLLVMVSILALLVILVIFLSSGKQHTLVHIALALFAAGICGNLWDRIFNDGQVRDFIDVYINISGREYRWPTFNLADTMLCIGIGLLFICAFSTGKFVQTPAQPRK